MQHLRNIHRNGYDFVALTKAVPALTSHVFINEHQTKTIDFSDQTAVKLLNTALLSHHYNINDWQIPDGYLCPPIPGRVDYIHHLADLLKYSNGNRIPDGKAIHALDIGTGASCIYPLLGRNIYQWRFSATDIDPISIDMANQNIARNPAISHEIDCKLQTDSQSIFANIIKTDDKFDLTMCNPPFHASLAEAESGTQRKWKNLSKTSNQLKTPKSQLNFGGQKAELWCPGGELSFVRQMIKESKQYKQQVLWFTCLISKKDNVKPLKFALKKAKVAQVKIIEMAQGNKKSRFIAWSYLTESEQKSWFEAKKR